MVNIAVLISGGGTNLQALIDNINGEILRKEKCMEPLIWEWEWR